MKRHTWTELVITFVVVPVVFAGGTVSCGQEKQTFDPKEKQRQNLFLATKAESSVPGSTAQLVHCERRSDSTASKRWGNHMYALVKLSQDHKCFSFGAT